LDSLPAASLSSSSGTATRPRSLAQLVALPVLAPLGRVGDSVPDSCGPT
jgi:hypothetical protein